MGIQDSRVVGLPLVNFTNTKANLLAITSPEVGMTAYATDTGELGFYTSGAWHWFNPDAVNHLIFNTSPTGVPSAEGVVAWNTTEKTLDLQTGWGPTLQVGHEIFVLVINGDPVDTIPNGSVVFPVTVFGGVPVVAPALASIHTLFGFDVAVATMDIPPESYGLATREGRVRNVDTSAWSEADTLYLSGENPGELTNVRPVFPNYTIQIAGCAVSHATEGMLHVKVKGRALDTTLNFWNGTFRETFKFEVVSNGTVVTGYLSPASLDHPDMTMLFTDGLSLLVTSPPAEIVLTPGTDEIPQSNYVYVLQSTKVLGISTSDWPVDVEHIKVAVVELWTAATTELSGAAKNQNWNDHIEAETGQGHLSHICQNIREGRPAKWISGVEGSLVIDTTPTPDDVWAKVTGGVVSQLHRQIFPILDMTQYEIDAVSTGSQTFTISDDGDLSSTFPDGRIIKVNGSTGNDGLYIVSSTLWSSPDFVITVEEAILSAVADGTIGDDIHVINHPSSPYFQTTNLNTQTLDAKGVSLANTSFAAVLVGIQNKTDTVSHLMLNLPSGSYGRLSPDDAVSDASNYSVYDIPAKFDGVGFLISRFIFQLQPGGTSWTLYATEDLRGKTPNVTAGGGGGGGGVSTFLGLTDTFSSFAGQGGKTVAVNEGETALEPIPNQTENTFYAGPSVAPAAAPGFRAMVAADIAVAAASYAYLPGRAGGQVLNGGTGAGENLTLSSTAHATKGKVLLGTLSAYNEALDRLGVGTTSAQSQVHVSTAAFSALSLERTASSIGRWEIGLTSAWGGGAGTLGFRPTVATGDFNIVSSANDSRFFVDTSVGDVGIGVTDPLDKLHVQGAILREGWFCGRAGTQTGFTGVLTDIDIDTEIRKDSTYFTHSAGSDNITFIKTGWYRISYSIDVANLLSNNSCVRIRVYDDGAAILQSYGYCNLDYYNYGQYATVSNSFLAYIVAGSVIDIRTDGQGGTGSFGSGCNYTVLDSSQITIERVDQ